jgi:hypothetical protein
MLKTPQTLALWLLVIFVFGGAEAQSKRPSKIPSKQPAQQTAPDQRGTDQSPFIVKVLPPEKTQTIAADDQKKRDEDRINTERLTDFTRDLVIVGALQFVAISIQAIFLWLAFGAAKNSADAARDQVALSREALITTERAFIYCERIHAIWTADKETELVTKWTFQPVWKNSGKTPTKRAVHKVSSWVGIDAGDIPPDFDFSNTDNASPTMIGPDATMHGRVLDLDVKTLQKIRTSEAHAYIWGWIDYNDIFAKTQRHRTEVCVEIQVTGNPIYKEGGFAYRMHGSFNGFDEDCYCKPKPYE